MNANVLRRPSVRAATALLTAGALMVAGAQAANATPGGPGSAPPSATVGEFTPNSSQPLSGSDLSFSQAKQELANGTRSKSTAAAAAAMGIAPTGATTSVAPAGALTTSKNLAVGYMTQVNSSWCGPATVAMMATYLGVGWTGTSTAQQNSAASLLASTLADGTAWYGADNVPSFPYGSWYPVADTLDYRIYQSTGLTWYVAAPVSGTPTSQYVNNLTFDVDDAHPMALNQYSIPGYQFYYQPNSTWYHWLVARGYSSSGASTVVNDPGWSAGNNATVPSTSGAHSVTYAIGARGYIW